MLEYTNAPIVFLSTPSARRATVPEIVVCSDLAQFLSTPSARRATSGRRCYRSARRISIHALREEGDDGRAQGRLSGIISIHALREEGDDLTGITLTAGI